MPQNMVDGGGITYVEYLRNSLTAHRAGVPYCCLEHVLDYPTLWEQVWPYGRPNYQVEAELQHALHETTLDAELQA